MDVELRAAREAFTIRDFEACHLEATDGSAARQGAPLAAPKLRSRTPVKLSGVSRQVAPPWQGEAARPTQVFDPFAAQAQGTHRSRILQEKAGRTAGRGGGAEASQQQRQGPSLSAIRRLRPMGSWPDLSQDCPRSGALC